MTAADRARSCSRRRRPSPKDGRVRASCSGGEFRSGGDSGTASGQDFRGGGMLRDHACRRCPRAGDDQLRQRQRPGHRPSGRGRSRRRGQRPADGDECRRRHGDGLGRPVPVPVSQDRTVRGQGPPRRICRHHPHADADDWVSLQPSHRAVGSGRRRQRDGHRRSVRPRDVHAARSPERWLRPRCRVCR